MNTIVPMNIHKQRKWFKRSRKLGGGKTRSFNTCDEETVSKTEPTAASSICTQDCPHEGDAA